MKMGLYNTNVLIEFHPQLPNLRKSWGDAVSLRNDPITQSRLKFLCTKSNKARSHFFPIFFDVLGCGERPGDL
jgi:hypothetical protein